VRLAVAPYRNAERGSSVKSQIMKAIRIHHYGGQDVRPMLQKAFKHDGPALVEVLVHRQELSMPPTITLQQAHGFGMFMLKAVINGRCYELIDLAKVNLFR